MAFFFLFSSLSSSTTTTSLKISALSLSLFSSLIFFFLSPPPNLLLLLPLPLTSHRSLLEEVSTTGNGYGGGGLLSVLPLTSAPLLLSIPLLSLLLLLYFYVLIKTAQDHFSLVTTKLSSLLRLSPSMAAVTLLALGNGAPDVFSSLAAVRSGHYRTGFGAILSAGTFVSAFVVGFVAIHAAPFSLNPATFVRDVSFYLLAALFLFYVYLSAEIFLWQAVGFVAFYLFFVGFVFWMDLGTVGADEREKGAAFDGRRNPTAAETPDCEIGESFRDSETKKPSFGLRRVLGTYGWFYGLRPVVARAVAKSSGLIRIRLTMRIKAFYSWKFGLVISKVWELPVSVLLKLTIPHTAPSEWSRFYMSANIALCPVALLYAGNSFIPFDHPIYFLLPYTHFPLWLIVLFASSSLALLHYIMEKEPPKTEQMPVVVIAFVMSVFWISTVAGELLNCLATLGSLLKLPPALLGLTVLAWGNSVGDLVADVAVAKAGHPEMAMAGCFAGPMFNMLVGLGTALVIQTTNLYPKAYELHFHVGIVIAFVFLLLSLMGSLLVITWHRFRVPRFWGFCLVGLYVVFTAVSLVIAKFSG
ncbi:hypothetical protein TIFTF001_013004 [Ficus carica]|uniref:Sodium/calcium exchanger membrane region domain-containing protein n=1 Tax=Ficus carica TaxID=3494 RepID=A0AA88A1B9_FICCA|nr:hypothetical protein TIFTF001_013004 [Ficus carica]